ncbi:MAG: hypothetical protein LBE39_12060 [Flavobacteriaceae bacterium]|jgi:hypothetical protein|nr:hypothetical protein [Flavobacteriaceae bacterium]
MKEKKEKEIKRERLKKVYTPPCIEVSFVKMEQGIAAGSVVTNPNLQVTNDMSGDQPTESEQDALY